MKIITQKDIVREIVERWKKQYPADRCFYGNDKQNILHRLAALSLDASASDVDQIIGNSTWTTMTCDECEKTTDWVLQVGEPPDYESRTVNLCRICVEKIKELGG